MMKTNEFSAYLSKYGLENMACIICKGILKNCCQGKCGCLFCEMCIEDYLNKGGQYCPGNTTRCKESIVKVHFNISRNIREADKNKISTVVMKAVTKILNDHSVLAKNQKPETVIKELENSQCIIMTMLDQLLNNGVFHETEGHIVIEKLLNALDYLERKSVEYSKLLEKSSTKTEIDKIPKKLSMDLDLQQDSTVTSPNPTEIATLQWEINNVSDLMRQNIDICSNYFYSTNDTYQMWLYFYPNATGGLDNPNLSFRFWIQDGPKHQLTIWPFLGNVTITVRNKSHPDVFQQCSKDSRINITMLKPYGRSELYNFPYNDLKLDETSQNDTVVIECIVRRSPTRRSV